MKALRERASVGGTCLLVLSLLAALAPACSGGGDEDGGAGEAGASGTGGREGSGGGAGGGPAPAIDLGTEAATATILDGFPQTIVHREGALLVAGWSEGDFWITRLDEAASVDSNFGSDGQTLVAFPAGEENILGRADFDVAYAIHATEGAIWLSGAVRGFSAIADTRWGVAKLDGSGVLDESFADDGLKLVDWTTGSRAYGVHVDSEDRIYLSGTIENATTDMAVARLLPTGDFDSSFSLTGEGAGAVLSDNRYEQGFASELLDDRILVAGGPDFAVAAVDLDGKYLPEFGDEGWATPATGTLYAMHRDGSSFFLAGPDEPNDESRVEAIQLVKMNVDGSVDASFGDAGIARLSYDFGSYVWPELEEQVGFEDAFVRVNGLTVLEDGSILVYADAVGFLVRYPLLMKVTPDGDLDTTFGQEGLVAFPVAMPLLAGAAGQPAKRLAASGNLAWFVDEGVFEGGNRGFLIRVELDRL